MRYVLILSLTLLACDDDASGTADVASDASDTAGDTSADPSDASNGSGPHTLETCMADVVPNNVADFLVFETDDGLTVGIARTIIDAPSVGETFPLGMVRFALVDGDTTSCVRDGAALEYTFGHHNWDEWGSAVVAGTRYEIRMRYFATAEPIWTDTLSAYDAATDAPIFEDAALTATDCRTDPPGDLNFCLNRPRSDQ